MADDGFVVVTYGRAAAGRGKRRGRGRSRARGSSAAMSMPALPAVDADQPLPKGFEETMRSRSEVLQDSAFFTAFVDKAIPAIAAFGGDDPLDCVCYGIGSIGDSKIAQFQFALLLAMRDKIEFRDVHLFEPVITNAEAEFIESRGIKIIAENENGRRKVERKTLFYMPHCEHTLYNSVLAANWSVLARISIVGNSFESYETNSIGTKLRDEHPHLADAVALATETPLAVFPPCEGAFNNTCVHVLCAPPPNTRD